MIKTEQSNTTCQYMMNQSLHLHLHSPFCILSHFLSFEMSLSSPFPSVSKLICFKREMKTLLSFKTELNMKKEINMKMFILKCSSSSTPSTKKEAVSPAQTSFSEEVLEEQKKVFQTFIEEVVKQLYLPPYRQRVKYGHWLHVTKQAVKVLFPGVNDIRPREGALNGNNIMEGDSFEYITEEELGGEFVLMEKGFMHLFDKKKIGYIAYHDVQEMKKNVVKEEEEKMK